MPPYDHKSLVANRERGNKHDALCTTSNGSGCIHVLRTMRRFVVVLAALGVLAWCVASVQAVNSITYAIPEFRGVYQASAIPIDLTYQYDGSAPTLAYFFFFSQSSSKVTTMVLNATAVFTGGAGSYHNLVFTFDAAAPTDSPYIVSSYNPTAPGGILPDGDYDITMGVRFSGDSTVTNSSSTLFTIDGVTGTPLLISPTLGVNDVFTGTTVSAQFRVPELPDLDSLRLKLYGIGPSAGLFFNLSLSFGIVFPSTTYLVSFNINNPTASSTVSAISGTGSIVPEGRYKFEFEYQDASGNPPKNASYSPVTIDTYTQAPSLTGWVTNGLYGNPSTIAYTLPEAPFPGSVTIQFYDLARETVVKYMQMVNDMSVSYSWNRNTYASNPPVVAELVLSMGLTDGLYDISLGYSDAASNPKNESIAYNVRFDAVTQPPTILSVVQTIASTLVTVSFKLPEQPYGNTATIVFTHNTTPSKSRTIIASVTQPYTLGSTITARINATNGLQYSEIVSMTPSTTLLEGAYTVQIKYQDLVPNPESLSASIPFSVDYTTLPITSSLPATGYSYSTPFVISCNVPDTPLNGQVTLRFKRSGESDIVLVMSVPTAGGKTFLIHTADVESSANVVSSTSSTLPDDTYDALTFTYQDAIQNPVATSSTGSFTIDTVTQPCTILLPTTGSEIDPVFNITYKLGEQALGTSEGLVIQMVGADTYILELASAVKTGGVWHSFALDSSSPTSSFAVDSGSSFPLGGYTLVMRYYDAVGNDAVTCTVSALSMEAASANPQLISPASHSQHANTMLVKYKLRSNLTSEPDALQLVMTGTLGSYTLDFHPVAHTPIGVELQFQVNLLDLTTVANISSVTGGVLVAEDIYTVTLRADSLDFGVYGTDDSSNVLVDRTTLAPVVISPVPTLVAANAYTNLLHVVFELPETPLANRTQVVILNQAQPSETVVFDVEGAALYNFALLRVVDNTLQVDHSNKLWTLNTTATEFTWPVAVNVTIKYHDQYSNPLAEATVSGVLVTGNATVNTTVVVVGGGSGGGGGAGSGGGYDNDSRVMFASSMYDALSIALLLGGVFLYVCACLVDSWVLLLEVRYTRLGHRSGYTQILLNTARCAATYLVLYAVYDAHDEGKTGVAKRSGAAVWLLATAFVVLVGEMMLRISSKGVFVQAANIVTCVAFVALASFVVVAKAHGIILIGVVACVLAAAAAAPAMAEPRGIILAGAWVLLLVAAAANYHQ